jgi:hypothetical protein
LPPHERAWRHPSELGPPEHEPTTGGGLLLIVTTATFGLILVGLLAVAVTPSSTSSTADGPTTVAAGRAVPATLAGFTPSNALPVVAPVGERGLALTTASAVGDAVEEIAARLPSGEIVEVVVVSVDHDRGLAVVALPAGVTTETFSVPDGQDLGPDDTVLVHAEEPIVVSLERLGSVDVGEGTPVTDADGNLLGLCTGGDGSDETTLAVADQAAVEDAAGSQPTLAPVTSAESVAATAGSD